MNKKGFLAIIGWIISGLLLWSLFSHMEIGPLWSSLKTTRRSLIVTAILINFVVIAAKTLRWHILMIPNLENKKTHKDTYLMTFKATLLGLAGNNLLPARGGDWYKIFLLGRWTHLSKASLASITGLDKLFDGLTILTLFGLFSAYQFFSENTFETFPAWAVKSSEIVAFVIVASLLISVLLYLNHRKIKDNINLGRFKNFLNNLGMGMKVLSKKHLLIWTFLISLISSALQILTIWFCQEAFGINLNFWSTSIIFIVTNIAIIVPSAPSGIGPFEAAAVLAYAWIGLKTETAFNITLMYHAAQVIPVTLIGLWVYMSMKKNI